MGVAAFMLRRSQKKTLGLVAFSVVFFGGLLLARPFGVPAAVTFAVTFAVAVAVAGAGAGAVIFAIGSLEDDDGPSPWPWLMLPSC